MLLSASNSHGKPRGKLHHHKMCPKDTIKGLVKNTRRNLGSCFSKAEESLGGAMVVLLPRTSLNPLPNSGDYYVLWFVGYLTGHDRARSLWIDNIFLIEAVCHLLTRSTGQIRRDHKFRCLCLLEVPSVSSPVSQGNRVQTIHLPCSHPPPLASRCGHLVDAHW